MNKKTLGALAAFAVLGLIAWRVTRAPEKGQRTADKPRPVIKLIAGVTFDTLDVTRGKVTTTLTTVADKYKMVSPVAYPADEYASKQAFEAIDKLEWGDVVTEQKSKHAEFEVGPEAIRVVARKTGVSKPLADLMIGKSVGPYTMVRVEGQDQVWQAVGSLKSAFDKDTAAWRDKTISTLKPDDVEAVEVNAGKAGTIQVKRAFKQDAGVTERPWEIVTTPVKIDKLDTSIPLGIISALQSLKANDFADDVKPDDVGVGNSASYVVVARTKDNKGVTVRIGNKKGDDEWYVRGSDNPQIFLVKKYALERLMKGPKEFGDKTICDLPEADVTEVAVTHGADSFTLVKSGADWKATRPAAFDVDGAKVTPMLGAFKDWKATSFAEDPSPKATGLGKPQATIAAKSKTSSCSLRIGDETKDKQSYYAQKVGSPDVSVLTKWTVERVLKKLDDLRKPGTKK